MENRKRRKLRRERRDRRKLGRRRKITGEKIRFLRRGQKLRVVALARVNALLGRDAIGDKAIIKMQGREFRYQRMGAILNGEQTRAVSN